MTFAARQTSGTGPGGGRTARWRAIGSLAAALALLLGSAPALAQPYGGGYGRGGYGRGGYVQGGYSGGYAGGYARPSQAQRPAFGPEARRGPPAPPAPRGPYVGPYGRPGRGPRPAAPYGFPAAPYYGAAGRAPSTGGFLPPEVRGPPILDFARFHLRRPPRGYFWFREGGFYVLASGSTGVVFEVIPAEGD